MYGELACVCGSTNHSEAGHCSLAPLLGVAAEVLLPPINHPARSCHSIACHHISTSSHDYARVLSISVLWVSSTVALCCGPLLWPSTVALYCGPLLHGSRPWLSHRLWRGSRCRALKQRQRGVGLLSDASEPRSVLWPLLAAAWRRLLAITCAWTPTSLPWPQVWPWWSRWLGCSSRTKGCVRQWQFGSSECNQDNGHVRNVRYRGCG